MVAEVSEELVAEVFVVGNIDIQQAVIVIVERYRGKRQPGVFDTGGYAHLRERSIAIVAVIVIVLITIFEIQVVHHKQVQETVIVEIGPDGRHGAI